MILIMSKKFITAIDSRSSTIYLSTNYLLHTSSQNTDYMIVQLRTTLFYGQKNINNTHYKTRISFRLYCSIVSPLLIR